EITPGPSEPSRSEKSALRHHPTNNSTGNAPIERNIACIIAGISDSASFTATWLKPQDRHSISISATAPGLSGRPASGFISLEDIDPRGPASHRVVVMERNEIGLSWSRGLGLLPLPVLAGRGLG